MSDFLDYNTEISESDEEEIAAAGLLLALAVKTQQEAKKRKKRSIWVKNWRVDGRSRNSIVRHLLPQLRAEDDECYKTFVRMSGDAFDYLLSKVKPLITKKDTVMREAIPAITRLALTLRYLGSGNLNLILELIK